MAFHKFIKRTTFTADNIHLCYIWWYTHTQERIVQHTMRSREHGFPLEFENLHTAEALDSINHQAYPNTHTHTHLTVNLARELQDNVLIF